MATEVEQIVEELKQWVMNFLGAKQKEEQEGQERQVAGGTVTPAASKEQKPTWTPPAPATGSTAPSREQYALHGIDPNEIRYLQNLERTMQGMNLTSRASEDIMAGKPTFGSGGVMEGMSGKERPEDYS